MTTRVLPPWTFCEFVAHLTQEGGYRRIPGPRRVYVTSDGRALDLDELCGTRPLWLCWAALRELPPKGWR